MTMQGRDVPESLRDATTDMARAIWSCRMNPTSKADQSARDEFDRWETICQQSVGESPTETYMDIENARCLSEPNYYSEPLLPFITRTRAEKSNQN